jgi:hypothetical protein
MALPPSSCACNTPSDRGALLALAASRNSHLQLGRPFADCLPNRIMYLTQVSNHHPFGP